MFDRNDKNSVTNRTIVAWIIGSLTSSMSSSTVYSLETEETVNKIRTPQPWVRFSTDYVRCFCNLPQCVSTGYMCKSSGGGCFSNFLDVGHHPRDYRGRHGCSELLGDNEDKALCDGKADVQVKNLIFCCHHDMCNHMDSPQTKDLLNDTFPGPVEELRGGSRPVDYSDSQVWFRAATIAVPVCGAVILFVLIALAVKILRSENQSSSTHKLGTSLYMPSQSKHGCDNYENVLRKPRPYEELRRIQVPLLVQNEVGTHHCGNKNETNAKLNLMPSKSLILDIEKDTSNCSKTNLVSHLNSEGKYSDVKYTNDDKVFDSFNQ